MAFKSIYKYDRFLQKLVFVHAELSLLFNMYPIIEYLKTNDKKL